MTGRGCADTAERRAARSRIFECGENLEYTAG